jgi:CRISPR-associated protein Csn2
MDSHLHIGEGMIPVLVIENQKHFYECLSELKLQTEGLEGRFVLSEDLKILPLNRYAEFIDSFINFEMNKKTLITKLYNRLSLYAVDEEHCIKTRDLVFMITEYVSELLLDFEGEFEVDRNFDLNAIFKGLGIKFTDDYNTLSEKLLGYMLLIREFETDKCFVFVNLKSYLDDAELNEFYKTVIGHGMNVLLVESSAREFNENECTVIIDKDLCEIAQ